MVTNRGKQTSIEFSDDLRARIDDFREAASNMVLATFVREAAELYMEDRLADEPRIKKQYDAIRQRRLAGERKNIRLLDGRSADD